MGKVLQIGIVNTKGSKIQNVYQVEALKGKGLVNDRNFNEKNQKECQITLVEIENINYYNKLYRTSIWPINFRRNIIFFINALKPSPLPSNM